MTTKSSRNLPFLEKNTSNDQPLYGTSLVLAKPLAVQYGGTGLDHPGTTGQVLYTKSDGTLGWESLAPYPTPTDFNIYSGSWVGSRPTNLKGWTGLWMGWRPG